MRNIFTLRRGEAKKLARRLSIIAGCVVVTVAGLLCSRYWFADSLARASYDLPFLWRPTQPNTDGIVLVYLDDASAKQLHQPVDDAWNRLLHVPLLNRLTESGARLVFYDIVFDQPSPEATRDVEFAEAIQRNGKVVLGASQDQTQAGGGIVEQRIFAPIKLLRKAAAAWGLLVFEPIDADYAVRQIFTGTKTATATWKAAELLGAPLTHTPREGGPIRWVNYYGPRNTFAAVNFAQALDANVLPNEFFKDKVVMIGGRSSIGYLAAGRDEFRTPFSRQVHEFTPGLEVHATILLNYLRNEWLIEMPLRQQLSIIILVGLLAGLLSALRPVAATIAAIALAAVIVLPACWLVWNRHLWFNWLTPAAVQVPVGLFWSVGSQYLLESRRRKELRRAFGFYLSPQMADRIADSDFDLKPGGKVVEATVIFTDLENFTTISEKLDPAEVSKILTDYFGQTTKCILSNRGTVIKYIGDAVFAAWGAPIDDPEHAARAAEAACDLRCLTDLQIRGKRLRTRIGIHSGRVLAGNLGSEFRFDYTMIGDPVNFASRLESLNKYLSTQVLISDAVRMQLGDRFITRRLGEFKVAGKTESVVIHELLCRCEAQNGEKEWIGSFEEGLSAFSSAEFGRARELMLRTREMREGHDGPAEFYLRKIEKLEGNGALDGWTGVVELTEK